jgi:gas vesicle protein
MDQENILVDNNEFEDSALAMLQIAKFKNLSRDFFQFDSSKEIDPLKNIKDYSKFFNFRLPYEIGDFFIELDEAPVYWIIKSPLIQHIENIYKSITLSTGPGSYKSIKEFYIKWIAIKSEEEKKYFAASVLNIAEKKSSGKGNFPFIILQAMVQGFDKFLFNPGKALEKLEISKEAINDGKINSDFRDELTYLINLFSAFVYFNQMDYSQAKTKLAEAITVKPAGISARFYQALVEVQETQGIVQPDFISELYNYDLSRLEFAIETNNVAMFEYFIKFPVTLNLFNHKEFAPSYNMIADYFYTARNDVETNIKTIRTKLNDFKDLNLTEHYNPKILQDIDFLEKIISAFFESNNLIFLGTLVKLKEKFTKIIEEVTEVMRQKNFVVVKERLLIYDKGLQEKYNELQIITKNYADQKIKLKENFDKNLEVIEQRAADNVAILEERIQNLQYIQSLNPRATFRNAMTYNLILSFTVFLLGGCAGYSNSGIDDPGKANGILAIIIISGFKWGMIAFLVGAIISLVAAGLALLEFTNQKQRLLQTINAVKNEKEYQKSYLKKEFEKTSKENEDRNTKLIDEHKKQMDNLKTERDNNEKVFKEEAEQKVHEETKQLRALLDS